MSVELRVGTTVATLVLRWAAYWAAPTVVYWVASLVEMRVAPTADLKAGQMAAQLAVLLAEH